jgi:hypothetical protein
MTNLQIKKIEKMARESTVFAKKALKKSNELQVFLSLLECKSGKINSHKSIDELFRKLKIA